MSVDWSFVRLKDYCTKIGSGSTPRGGANVYLDSGNVCLIRSQNIYNDGFSENGLVFISDSDAEKLNNVEIELNDVLINITGDSVARVCLAPKDKLPARVNQHVAIIRTVKNELDPKFVRYFLTDRNTQNHLLTLAGTGATRNALTKGMLEEFLVPKPDILIQKKISKILSDLDEKIHLNNQINQTLESIAQTIFKSWYIDFDPVRAKIAAKLEGADPEIAAMCVISGKSEAELKQMPDDDFAELQATAALFPDELVESDLGEVPKGWELQSLYDTAEFVNGAAFKAKDFSSNTNEGLPIIKIAELKQGLSAQTKYTNLSFDQKYRVRSGDIFYSWSGSPETSLDVFKWFGGDGWLNQHIFKINTESKGKTYFVYYLLKYLKPTLIRLATNKQTTGLGHITVADMKSLQVIKPEEHLFLRYAKIVAPFYEKESLLKQEIINLAMLRDTLLPKLLSGEVSLGDVIDA